MQSIALGVCGTTEGPFTVEAMEPAALPEPAVHTGTFEAMADTAHSASAERERILTRGCTKRKCETSDRATRNAHQKKIFRGKINFTAHWQCQ